MDIKEIFEDAQIANYFNIIKNANAQIDTAQKKAEPFFKIRDDNVLSLDEALNVRGIFSKDLFSNPDWETSQEFFNFENTAPELAVKYKRIITFVLKYDELLKAYGLNNQYAIDVEALKKIATLYVEDLGVLKKRYKIKRVQLPKIAGLMTNLIVKYRPIIPRDPKNNPASNINELFAINYALSICSDFSNGKEFEAFLNTAEYKDFFNEMLYLLNRNYTTESLIMIYRTLCLFKFPSFLSEEVDG